MCPNLIALPFELGRIDVSVVDNDGHVVGVGEKIGCGRKVHWQRPNPSSLDSACPRATVEGQLQVMD
jgi:hypothetical protein